MMTRLKQWLYPQVKSPDLSFFLPRLYNCSLWIFSLVWLCQEPWCYTWLPFDHEDPRPPIRYAQLTLNSSHQFHPSSFVHRFHKGSCLCLCSFTSRLLQLSSFWLSSVSPKQTTEGSEQLLALSWEFLKQTTFLLILLLFIDCSLIHGYSTNSLLSVIIASTRLLLTTWLNSWESVS